MDREDRTAFSNPEQCVRSLAPSVTAKPVSSCSTVMHDIVLYGRWDSGQSHMKLSIFQAGPVPLHLLMAIMFAVRLVQFLATSLLCVCFETVEEEEDRADEHFEADVTHLRLDAKSSVLKSSSMI